METIEVEGFYYKICTVRLDGNIQWSCLTKSCPARVDTTIDNEVLKIRHYHIHANKPKPLSRRKQQVQEASSTSSSQSRKRTLLGDYKLKQKEVLTEEKRLMNLKKNISQEETKIDPDTNLRVAVLRQTFVDKVREEQYELMDWTRLEEYWANEVDIIFE